MSHVPERGGHAGPPLHLGRVAHVGAPLAGAREATVSVGLRATASVAPTNLPHPRHHRSRRGGHAGPPLHVWPLSATWPGADCVRRFRIGTGRIVGASLAGARNHLSCIGLRATASVAPTNLPHPRHHRSRRGGHAGPPLHVWPLSATWPGADCVRRFRIGAGRIVGAPLAGARNHLSCVGLRATASVAPTDLQYPRRHRRRAIHRAQRRGTTNGADTQVRPYISFTSATWARPRVAVPKRRSECPPAIAEAAVSNPSVRVV